MQKSETVISELQQVKKFLAESKEFKKLQELAANVKPTVFSEGNVPERPESQVMVEQINKCNTFSEIIQTLAFKKDAPPMALLIPATFVLVFFEQSANIGYYTLWFKINLENKMKELGLSTDTQPSNNRPSTP